MDESNVDRPSADEKRHETISVVLLYMRAIQGYFGGNKVDLPQQYDVEIS